MDNSELKKRLIFAISRLPIIKCLEAYMDFSKIEELKKSILSIFLSNLSERQINFDLAKKNIYKNLYALFKDSNIELDSRSIYDLSNAIVLMAWDLKENNSGILKSVVKFEDL